MTVFILLLTASVFQLPSPPSSDPASRMPEWARPGRCGPNCLYVFLQILYHARELDRPISYEEVTTLVPGAPDQGCSLADLASAGRQLGLDLEVRKVAVHDFPHLRTPFIAHLNLLDKGANGHFITVYRYISGKQALHVWYVDGSTGQT